MLNIFVILKNDFQYIKIHCTHYLSNNLKNNTVKKPKPVSIFRI